MHSTIAPAANSLAAQLQISSGCPRRRPTCSTHTETRTSHLSHFLLLEHLNAARHPVRKGNRKATGSNGPLSRPASAPFALPCEETGQGSGDDLPAGRRVRARPTLPRQARSRPDPSARPFFCCCGRSTRSHTAAVPCCSRSGPWRNTLSRRLHHVCRSNDECGGSRAIGVCCDIGRGRVRRRCDSGVARRRSGCQAAVRSAPDPTKVSPRAEWLGLPVQISLPFRSSVVS